MQILRASTPLLAIVISSAFSLTAQTRHYRMELSSGTSGYVILENDSQSSIEAFHVKGQCGSVGMEATSDILEGPNGRFPNVAADTRSQRGGIHRWERVSFANVTFIAQPQPCTWKVEMNAVIFSDGSYEGDDAQVKALQAERDGIAASINYWAARMKTPPATPAELDLIEADAKTQSQNDRAS